MSEHPVCLVTGAARGIGYGIAQRLAGDGWHVIMGDLDEAGCRIAAERIGPQATAIALDVRDERSIEQAVNEAQLAHGRLDGLVNNAAISDPGHQPVETLRLDQWQAYLDTNLTGAFLLCKHALPMLRAQRGAIVNIGSSRAWQSEPHTEAYAATKGGLEAFTHALAISAGPQVRVNCIHPGWIDTRPPATQRAEPLTAADHAQHPVGRVGTPADIAALTAFLLSAEAGFITGQSWAADGGMTRRMIYAE
ncbi:oxidoreductase [Halorhodospira abdelmalekii]|uniref:SDR family oxidoreductase n=1 Tax=Halorhodospira abdelmalekii TaxID=421629 RepID=UPI00190564CF|nr:SDR family oxidoreductase [Halorhodospira abdelmalekii]MBK1736228.1 oxidoreductase [Halorhodospira abdelmalekii]